MCRVLVIEDEPDVREMMAVLLDAYGYRTRIASNGVEGLALLRDHRPCLVLLDLMMPVMDGFEFRRRQPADPTTASIPVVCLTAMFDSVDVKRVMDVPCLTKPLRVEALVEVVA